MRRFGTAVALAVLVAGISVSAEPAGGLLDVAVNDRVSFSPQFLFTQKATKLKEAGKNIALRLRVLQAPLLFRMRVATAGGVRPFMVAGPALGFIASATDQFGRDEGDLRDDVKAMELSGIVGAGVQFGRGAVEARYDHGFTNLSEDGAEAKSRTFSVLVGVALGR